MTVKHCIMSEYNQAKQVVLMFAAERKNWGDSAESIRKQKATKSETSLKMDSVDLVMFQSEMSKSEKGAISRRIQPPKLKQKEVREEKTLHVPPKSLSGDLTILRATQTPPESKIQMAVGASGKPKTPAGDISIFDVIDGSENAPKDRVPWKYLKRSRQYNKEKKKFMITWLRTVHYHCNHMLSRKQMNLTCQNCTLNVRTNIKHVNTIRTRRNACILTACGLCSLPYMLFVFKDVVHTCPFCNIYFGVCPAFKNPWRTDTMTDAPTRKKSILRRAKPSADNPGQSVRWSSAV